MVVEGSGQWAVGAYSCAEDLALFLDAFWKTSSPKACPCAVPASGRVGRSSPIARRPSLLLQRRLPSSAPEPTHLLPASSHRCTAAAHPNATPQPQHRCIRLPSNCFLHSSSHTPASASPAPLRRCPLPLPLFLLLPLCLCPAASTLRPIAASRTSQLHPRHPCAAREPDVKECDRPLTTALSMSLPPDYSNEISALDREILKHQPNDILQFCASFFNRRLESQRAEFLLSQHSSPQGRAESNFPGNNPFGTSPSSSSFQKGTMQRLEEEEEGDMMASPTAPSFAAADLERSHANNQDNSSPFGTFGNDHGSSSFGSFGNFGGFGGSSRNQVTQMPPIAGESQNLPSNYNTNRRVSVSAESLNPASSANDSFTAPYHHKSDDQISRLKTAVSGNFLFSHLDDEQAAQVLGALHEKPIPAKGIKVIQQGDVGDYFYVVERGAFDIYVNQSGKVEAGEDGLGAKVGTVGPGGSFGELALMYNAPRAATVMSSEPSTLWALDRVTFRRILMDSAFQRRRMYEGFLEEVPLLASLTPYERSKIADALETKKYPPGTTIIQEGDIGESFYILESGEAYVYKRGIDQAVKQYKKGDYFGELALLNDAPRAASVVSNTEVKVATLGKNGFQRLLGPVEGIMRRNDPSKEGDNVDPLSRAA